MNPTRSSKEDQSLQRLHEEHALRLTRLAWAICRDWSLAADAVQEAFLVLAQREDAVPADQVVGWLVRAVQNCAHNLRRKHQREEQGMAVGAVREANEEYQFHSPQASLEDAEQIEQLRDAIAKLPDEQRRVVEMRIAEDKSFAAIADELKLPLGTVLSRMRLAIEKLRRSVSDTD